MKKRLKNQSLRLKDKLKYKLIINKVPKPRGSASNYCAVCKIHYTEEYFAVLIKLY